MNGPLQAVLFDLDGTLVDSAPDLAGAINQVREADGLTPVSFERLRPMVGSGARGMIGAAYGITPGDARYEALKSRFLSVYAQQLLQRTTVFEGVWAVLETLERRELRWGIVTNKAYHLAQAVTSGLGLHPRAGVLIGGDSTPHPKPHPEPLLEACRRLSVDPARCAYVGDDHRDMKAGRAAGMGALAAQWGYIDGGTWGADAYLAEPTALIDWLAGRA